MKRIHVLMGLCALICLTSCAKEEEKKEEEVNFLVTTPLVRDTTITKDYVSQIRAYRHIEMRAQQRGYIQNIYVDEGQSVNQGQMMFQIMPKLYEAELQKAEAEASFANIEYQNTKKLADNKIVAPNELSMANAKLDKAKAEVSLAQTHLGFTKIRAPFSGIMDHFQVRLGSMV
ncbi:MAG: biotin/lipoyl-binding protein, partial [Cytophagaceae bacterium]